MMTYDNFYYINIPEQEQNTQQRKLTTCVCMEILKRVISQDTCYYPVKNLYLSIPIILLYSFTGAHPSPVAEGPDCEVVGLRLTSRQIRTAC